MIVSEVEIIRSMASVSETFVRIADALRRRPDVRRVSRPCWLRAEERLGEEHFRVGSGPGFRMEWYAEAEFADGRLLTFSQEAAWHDGEWVVDASVRATMKGDEEAVFELPRRFALSAEEVISELQSQSRIVEDRYEDALQKLG